MRAQPYHRRRTDAVVEAAVAKHGAVADAALPVLQEVQAESHGFLSHQSLGAVADALHVHDARVYGAASFYSLLATKPCAGNVLRVCDGPVCMLHGADGARAALTAATAGGEWTVSRCSCMGLCDRAPAALVGSEPCGPIRPEAVGDVLTGCRGAMPSYAEPRPGETRVTLARVGRIDPDEITSRALRRRATGEASWLFSCKRLTLG